MSHQVAMRVLIVSSGVSRCRLLEAVLVDLEVVRGSLLLSSKDLRAHWCLDAYSCLDWMEEGS